VKRLAALLVMVALAIPIASVSAADTFTFECNDPSGPDVTDCWVAYGFNIHGGELGTVVFRSSQRGTHTINLPAGIPSVGVFAASRTAAGVNTAVVVQHRDSAGCPTGWHRIGLQSWWSDPGLDPVFESQHGHADAFCWPVNNTVVTGSQTFTIPMQTHNLAPGWKVTRIRAKVYYTSGSPGTDIWACTAGESAAARTAKGCPATWPVPNADGDVAWTVTPTIDLARLQTQRLELRWAIYLEGDGKRQFFSARTFLCNGDCDPSARTPFYQGNASWYSGVDYVDARIHSSWPASADPPSGTPATTPSPVVTPTLMPPPSVCA
jgi:hypothetical protein